MLAEGGIILQNGEEKQPVSPPQGVGARTAHYGNSMDGSARMAAASIALLLDFLQAFARIHLFDPRTSDGFHWRLT